MLCEWTDDRLAEQIGHSPTSSDNSCGLTHVERQYITRCSQIDMPSFGVTARVTISHAAGLSGVSLSVSCYRLDSQCELAKQSVVAF